MTSTQHRHTQLVSYHLPVQLTDRQTDVEREIIIPHHYRVAVYKYEYSFHGNDLNSLRLCIRKPIECYMHYKVNVHYRPTITRTLYIPSEPRFGDQYLHCSGIDFCLKAIF